MDKSRHRVRDVQVQSCRHKEGKWPLPRKVAIEFCLDFSTIHCEEDVNKNSWSAIS